MRRPLIQHQLGMIEAFQHGLLAMWETPDEMVCMPRSAAQSRAGSERLAEPRCLSSPSREVLRRSTSRDGLQQKEEPSPRELECHLMVAKSLAALDQTEVPDQADAAATHSSQSVVLKSLHREMDAPLSYSVNSRRVSSR